MTYDFDWVAIIFSATVALSVTDYLGRQVAKNWEATVCVILDSFKSQLQILEYKNIENDFEHSRGSKMEY